MDYQNYSATSETTELFPKEVVIYGGFWERFFAALIDGIILVIPNYLLQAIFGELEGSVIFIVVGWLYYASMESGANQATFGKKAMGLKVTDEGGSRISFGQATGRHFGRYISTLILLIGYLMMLWDDKKQTLHDKMAGTLVIKNKTSW
jgi:uncharacterized RDD family membrane protein YckC